MAEILRRFDGGRRFLTCPKGTAAKAESFSEQSITPLRPTRPATPEPISCRRLNQGGDFRFRAHHPLTKPSVSALRR